MQSILEELYMGNIGFDAKYYPQNSLNIAAKKPLGRIIVGNFFVKRGCRKITASFFLYASSRQP